MNLSDLKKLLLDKEKNISYTSVNEMEKINLIKNLFNNENCFFDIDMKLAIDILYFLGIEKDSLLKVYYELVSPKNYKKDETVEIINLNNV